MDIVKWLVENPLVFCVVDLEAAVCRNPEQLERRLRGEVALNDILNGLYGAKIGSKNLG